MEKKNTTKMEMYLLICIYNGVNENSYQTFSDLKEAKKAFKEEVKEEAYDYIVLLKTGPNKKFRFSNHGFEGKAIKEFWNENSAYDDYLDIED